MVTSLVKNYKETGDVILLTTAFETQEQMHQNYIKIEKLRGEN